MRNLILGLILMQTALFAGCKQEDGVRPTSLRAGVYQGEPMPVLSSEQVKRLEARGNLLR
jgi:hypothetical protein